MRVPPEDLRVPDVLEQSGCAQPLCYVLTGYCTSHFCPAVVLRPLKCPRREAEIFPIIR